MLNSRTIFLQGRKLVWECLTRDDELLHVAVYEWLVSKHLGSGKMFCYSYLMKFLNIYSLSCLLREYWIKCGNMTRIHGSAFYSILSVRQSYCPWAPHRRCHFVHTSKRHRGLPRQLQRCICSTCCGKSLRSVETISLPLTFSKDSLPDLGEIS